MLQVYWLTFLMVFVRTAAFVFMLPFASWRGIPVLVRVAVSLSLAFLLFMPLEGKAGPLRGELDLALQLGGELVVGLTLGFLVTLMFAVFRMAGQMMDMQGGLMLSGVFDPQLGGQVTLMGQFYYIFAVVFYLSVDGHHRLINALAESFSLVPLGTGMFAASTAGEVARLFASMFLLAFQISAPVLMILLCMDLALGFIAKTVPQLHVFIEGLPLKIALALFSFTLLLPLLSRVMQVVFDGLERDLIIIMRSWY